MAESDDGLAEGTPDQTLHITLTSAPASDSWGFVGVVRVGEHEAYRSIRAYSSPTMALTATQDVLADVLGTLMAGQEWRTAQDEYGHAPRRTELGFGLKAERADPPEHAREGPRDPSQTDASTSHT